MFYHFEWYHWGATVIVASWIASWALLGVADLVAPTLNKSRWKYVAILDYLLGKGGRSIDQVAQLKASLHRMEFIRTDWLEAAFRRLQEASQIEGDVEMRRLVANRLGDVVRRFCAQSNPQVAKNLVVELRLLVDRVSEDDPLGDDGVITECSTESAAMDLPLGEAG